MTLDHGIEGGEGVTLRPVVPGDLPELFRLQADPASNAMAVVNARSREAFEAAWEKIWDDPEVVPRVIVARGVLVGTVSCFRSDGVDYVGYWIDREHWGKGYASRGLELLLREVTKRPLVAKVARTNAGSLRVAGRCGFELVEYVHEPATERFPAAEVAVLRLG